MLYTRVKLLYDYRVGSYHFPANFSLPSAAKPQLAFRIFDRASSHSGTGARLIAAVVRVLYLCSFANRNTMHVAFPNNGESIDISINFPSVFHPCIKITRYVCFVPICYTRACTCTAGRSRGKKKSVHSSSVLSRRCLPQCVLVLLGVKSVAFCLLRSLRAMPTAAVFPSTPAAA